jgi:hypothetical protein
MKTKLWAVFMLWVFVGMVTIAGADDTQTVQLHVRKGNTLIEICEAYLAPGYNWQKVAKLNKIENPHKIYPGQTITVPVEMLRGVPLEGNVTFVKGDVLLHADGQWQTPVLNDPIRQGNQIKTGPDSALEITYKDGVSFLVTPNSTISITSAREKGMVLKIFDFFLGLGRTTAKVRHLTGQSTRFKIGTPSAVTAARGTDFRVGADALGDTRCEVLAGSVGVKAVGPEVVVAKGQGIFVKKGQAPQKPSKLLAAPAPLNLLPAYKALPLQVRFEKNADARKYRVMISKDKAAKDLVLNKLIAPSEPLNIVDLEDGDYFLTSRAIDGLDLEGFSLKPVAFYLRVNPLPPFVEEPLYGARYRTKEVEFKWMMVSDAKNYHVQLSTDPTFAALPIDLPKVKKNRFKTGPLDFGTHYVRISSVAADGYQGEWSDGLKFEIVPPPPSPPVEKPAVDEKSVTIRWRDLGQGISYHFQMAKDPEFKTPLLDQKVAEPTIKFEKPTDSGTYYIRTSSIDSEGYEGSFSKPQSFEIKQSLLGPALGVGTIITILLLFLL